MSESTSIAWTHHTFNPWSGCAKVSAGCANCYAAALPPAMRRNAAWGPNEARVAASDSYWRQPLAWNRAAQAAGERRRVFCASVADVFEDRDDLDAHRERLAGLIAETPNLDWLLLTKRAGAILHRAPKAWANRWPRNVWLGVSVEDQRAADERIPELLRVPAAVRFLSMEPLLGPVDLDIAAPLDGVPGCVNSLTGVFWPAIGDAELEYERREPFHERNRIDWVIVGGESGRKARPCDVDWIESIVTQCRSAGVPAFVKQLGARPRSNGVSEGWELADAKGGNPAEWPESLRVRQFPEVA